MRELKDFKLQEEEAPTEETPETPAEGGEEEAPAEGEEESSTPEEPAPNPDEPYSGQ